MGSIHGGAHVRQAGCYVVHGLSLWQSKLVEQNCQFIHNSCKRQIQPRLSSTPALVVEEKHDCQKQACAIVGLWKGTGLQMAFHRSMSAEVGHSGVGHTADRGGGDILDILVQHA